MTEETKQTEVVANEEVVVDEEQRSDGPTDRALPVRLRSPQSPNTKAAEKKLKEMSRKAKERGKPQNAQRARSEAVIKFNQNWFLGGLGISAVIMIGYFIYKSRGQGTSFPTLRSVSEPPSELQPFHHPPPEKKGEQEKPNSLT